MSRAILCSLGLGSLGLALALASGCSLVNDPAQHMGGAEPVPGDALCARLMRMQCEQYARCCRTAPDTFDVEACFDALLPSCESGIGMYLADSRTGYDPVVAGRIIAEGEALSAVCSPEIAHWGTTREGLYGVFAGSVEPGGTCTPRNDMDFAAFLSCDRLENACMLTVGDRFLCAPRVGRDQGCLLNGDCQDGLACVWANPLDPSTGRCTTLLPPGSPCRQPSDCASYYCDIPTGLMVGVCVEGTDQNVYCGVVD